MKIIITESQKHLLNELEWLERVHEHIEHFRIPMTPKIYQILYSKTKVKSFHISDIKNIDRTKSLIGSKKTLSTFNYMTEDFASKIRGVQTNGGIIYEMIGDLVLYSPFDVMSRPDENGIRWVDYWSIIPRHEQQNWINIGRNIVGIHGFKTIEKKERTKTIKEYFKEAENFIINNKNDILKYSLRYMDSISYWDEILITNIQIRDIFWDCSWAEKIYQDIWRKDMDDMTLSDREKNILKNYKDWVDKIEKKLQSISTGKVHNADEISSVDFIKQRGGHISEKTYQIPPEISKQLSPYL